MDKSASHVRYLRGCVAQGEGGSHRKWHDPPCFFSSNPGRFVVSRSAIQPVRTRVGVAFLRQENTLNPVSARLFLFVKNPQGKARTKTGTTPPTRIRNPGFFPAPFYDVKIPIIAF